MTATRSDPNLKRERVKCRSINHIGPIQFRIEAIYRVFYSAKHNSCLCAKYTLYPAKQGEGSEDVEIIDILNQEQVWYTHYPVARQREAGDSYRGGKIPTPRARGAHRGVMRGVCGRGERGVGSAGAGRGGAS